MVFRLKMSFQRSFDLSLPSDVARLIDHTLLKPEATRDEIRRICAEAREYKFASVCTNGCWTPLVAEELEDSGVRVCAVVGFPLGAMSSSAKVAETLTAVEDGANEIDMVMNVGALLGGETAAVEDDIRWIVESSHARGAIVKVILETVLLNDDQKVLACEIAQRAGADFVKTSTGFNKGGANAADVALMRRTVGESMGVKASGGIRTFDDLRTMVEAGANRIGASAGVSILNNTSFTNTSTAVPNSNPGY